MTIVIVRKLENGLEICTDTGMWRGEVRETGCNKIFESESGLILSACGDWEAIHTLKTFIFEKSKKIESSFDLLTIIKDFNEFISNIQNCKGKYADIEVFIYCRNNHKLFYISRSSFVRELEENEIENIGAAEGVSSVFITEGFGIKEVVDKTIKISSDVAGHSDYRFYKKI